MTQTLSQRNLQSPTIQEGPVLYQTPRIIDYKGGHHLTMIQSGPSGNAILYGDAGILAGQKCVHMTDDGPQVNPNHYFKTQNHTDFIIGTGDFTFAGWFFMDLRDAFFRTMFNAPGGCTMQSRGFSQWILSLYLNGYLGNGSVAFPDHQWCFTWFRRTGTLVEAGFTPAGTSFNTTPNFSTNSGNNCNNSDSFYLGISGDNNAPWKGKIQQVIWAKTSFNGTQLTEMYNLGGADVFGVSFYNSILAYWKCNEPFYATEWDISTHFWQSWALNEGTGATCYDAGGTQTLTTFNSPTWGTDSYGGYINLNGTNQYLTSSGDYVNHEWGTGAGYICGMFNMADNVNRCVFSKSAEAAANDGFICRTYGTGVLALYLGNAWVGATGVLTTGVTYFYLFKRDGGGNWALYLQPITDASFNTTPVLSGNTAVSLGVNTNTFYIGYDTAPYYFNGKMYRHHMIKGQTISDTEAIILFQQYKNGTYELRGLLNVPTAIPGKTIIYSAPNQQVYSVSLAGTNLLNGGMKLGWIYGSDDTHACEANYLFASKFTAIQDAVVTHIFARYNQTVSGGQHIKYGIYTHDERIAAPDRGNGVPGTLLAQTIEYGIKGGNSNGDIDSVVRIPLLAPCPLQRGKKYWICFIHDAVVGGNLECFNLCGSGRSTHGLYWSSGYPYTSGMPATVSVAATGGMTPLAIGAI